MKRLLIPGFLSLASLAANGQQTSALWGDPAAPTWDPSTSRLPDFTNVGYKAGNTPIPDWPAGVNVLDFGAIPDDRIDDSQAFIDAIAACPPYHAVVIPAGQFTILRKIPLTKDNVVLRGENMYESVVFFPKKLGEIYLQEIGYGPEQTPIYDFFFNVVGGSGKGVENLTFKFREQRMKGTWEYEGAGAISFSNVTDSWLRNVRFLNYESGVQVQSTYCSFINLIFDQYNGRCGTDGVRSQNTDAYASILPRNCSHNLFHNITVEGYVLQPIDLNESSNNNVYSRYRSGERMNRSAAYHGGSSRFNLYTDLDKGVVTPKSDPSRSDETYWNIDDDDYQFGSVAEEVYNSANSLIFVGYGDDFAAKTNDPDLWYEPGTFGQVSPGNLYLAQLDYFGEPRPVDFPVLPPSPYDQDVFGVVPTDDAKPGHWYFKFDLSDANLTHVEHARLRVHMNSRQIPSPPYTFRAWSVTDDAWSEDTVIATNQPGLVSELDSTSFDHAEDNRVLEFDVTVFARSQLVGGDGVVSLALVLDEAGLQPGIHFKETGPRPELIIERTASAVPGPPVPPRNFGTTPLVGNILLDWEDHPEPDVTYNVYRSPYLVNPTTGEFTEGYNEYIDTGLVTSDIADIQSSTNWRPGRMYHGVVYKYKITAVDDHGYESPRSREFYGATLHPSNDPPAFVQTVNLPGATVGRAYNHSMAGDASDPESDPLHFHIVSGPEWLTISSDGVLGGVPGMGDEGTHQVTFQVTAIGGSARKAVTLTVAEAIDEPAGAPAVPSGVGAVPGDGSVTLDWADNSEADFASYTVRRSTVSGSGYSEVRGNLTSSDFVDSPAVNGTTYYYVVTAIDHMGNESAVSSEVSATPRSADDATFSFNFGTGADNLASAGLSTYVENTGVGEMLVTDAPGDGKVGIALYNEENSVGREAQGFHGVFAGLGPGDTADFVVRTTFTTPARNWNSPAIGIHLFGNTATASYWNTGIFAGVNGNRELKIWSGGVENGTVLVSGAISEQVLTESPTTIEVTGTYGSYGADNLQLTLTVSAAGSTASVTTTVNTTGLATTSRGFGVSANSDDDNRFLVTKFLVDIPSIQANQPPAFTSDPVAGAAAFSELAYSGSLADLASDPESDPLTFSKLSGPAWLHVATDGTLSGTPGSSDIGMSSFTIKVADGHGGTANATLEIVVLNVNGPIVDDDNDGLDDIWETTYFPGQEAVIDGSRDSDGDGVRDFFEYLYGSAPNDPNSRGFDFRAEPNGTGGTAIKWATRPGFVLKQHYDIQVSSNLVNWDPLPAAHYTVIGHPVDGRTAHDLEITHDYGGTVLLRLVKP